MKQKHQLLVLFLKTLYISAFNGIVEAEGSFQLIDHFLRSFNVHQNVVCFVQFVDRVSQLIRPPSCTRKSPL